MFIIDNKPNKGNFVSELPTRIAKLSNCFGVFANKDKYQTFKKGIRIKPAEIIIIEDRASN